MNSLEGNPDDAFYEVGWTVDDSADKTTLNVIVVNPLYELAMLSADLSPSIEQVEYETTSWESAVPEAGALVVSTRFGPN